MDTDKIAAIVKDYNDDMKIKDIAIKHDIRYNRVWSVLRSVPGMAAKITARKAENSREAQLKRYRGDQGADR